MNTLKKQSLEHAIVWNDVGRVKSLLEECTDTEELQSYLSHAVGCNRPEMVRLLCQHGAPRVGEMLPSACFYGYSEVVNTLLEYGIDMEATNSDGRSSLVQATQSGRIDIVAALLRHGAKVDGVSPWNRTALMEACLLGRFEIAELLLDNGAAVDGNNYSSPLQQACGATCQEAIVELLIRRGAPVNKPSGPHGYTPLLTARCWANHAIIEMLVTAGATA